MLSVKFDIKKVNKLCDSLKDDLKSVKGASAGIIENQKYPNGLDLISNALIQEYGCTIHITDKMRKWFYYQGFPLRKDKTSIVIPPRPFLRTALKRQKEWVKFVKEFFDADQNGGMTLKQIARQVGVLMEKAIKEVITSNMPPEKSQVSIELESRKRKTGTKSSGTLRDTGLLLGSIHNEVIKSKQW
ncbi:MAG: hypothetical protein J6S67_21935 [Methanobrevibacter sp.]|nr:hypothetical protein [Methanobrevibacter sp.]